MSITALRKLVGSSKASVLIAAIVLLGALVYTGKLPVENFEAALKWLIGTWFVAHAGEQSAKALANGKVNAAAAKELAKTVAEPAPEPDDAEDGEK